VVEQHEFSVILGESLGRLLDPALADRSCGRTTDASDLAVLLRSQRNAPGGAELVDDLLDRGRSFDGHGRAGTRHPRRKHRCRRNGLTPSWSTQRRAASARRAADILTTPAARDLGRVV
jgi:hypothetical protein